MAMKDQDKTEKEAALIMSECRLKIETCTQTTGVTKPSSILASMSLFFVHYNFSIALVVSTLDKIYQETSCKITPFLTASNPQNLASLSPAKNNLS